MGLNICPIMCKPGTTGWSEPGSHFATLKMDKRISLIFPDRKSHDPKGVKQIEVMFRPLVYDFLL